MNANTNTNTNAQLHIHTARIHTARSYRVKRNSSWGYQPIKSKPRHNELTLDGFVVFLFQCVFSSRFLLFYFNFWPIPTVSFRCLFVQMDLFARARTRTLLYRKVFAFTIDNDECMQSLITHSRNGSCVGANGFDKYLTVFIVAFIWMEQTNQWKRKKK